MRTLARRTHSALPPWTHYTPVITWTIIMAYASLAVGMTLQPERFTRTPSYANLAALAPIPVWGSAYMAVALALLTWRGLVWQGIGARSLGVLARTVATILTFWWLGAFVIRYVTDDATTIVNIVSWATFMSLIARSSVGLDSEARP